MSIRVMSYVWRYSKAAGGDLLLELAIADFSNEDGTGAYPSIPTLAKKTRTDERTVQRMLKRLLDLGRIRIKQGGGRMANTYEIIMDAHGEGRQIATGDTAATPAVTELCHPIRHRTVKKSTPTPSLLDGIWKERLGAIYGRRKTTKWSNDEVKALSEITPIDNDELDLVERYYKSERKKEKNFCRTTLLRLIRHWPSEVDRARAWEQRILHRKTTRDTTTIQPKEGDLVTDADFKRAGAEARKLMEGLRKKLNPQTNQV